LTTPKLTCPSRPLNPRTSEPQASTIAKSYSPSLYICYSDGTCTWLPRCMWPSHMDYTGCKLECSIFICHTFPPYFLHILGASPEEVSPMIKKLLLILCDSSHRRRTLGTSVLSTKYVVCLLCVPLYSCKVPRTSFASKHHRVYPEWQLPLSGVHSIA
jgi:hypothetical protein